VVAHLCGQAFAQNVSRGLRGDSSPPPDPSTLYDHVYAEIDLHGRLFLDGRESASAGGRTGGSDGRTPAGGAPNVGPHG